MELNLLITLSIFFIIFFFTRKIKGVDKQLDLLYAAVVKIRKSDR